MTVCLKPQVHAYGVDSVSSLRDIQHSFVYRDLLFNVKEIIAIYCVNNIKYINTLCGCDVMLQHLLQSMWCLLMCFKWFMFVENFDYLYVRICCTYSMYNSIYVRLHVPLLNLYVKEFISTP